MAKNVIFMVKGTDAFRGPREQGGEKKGCVMEVTM